MSVLVNGWLMLMGRQERTPAIPMWLHTPARRMKNCHAVCIWTWENSVWFIFIQRPQFSCRHAAITLYACRDVKKHHCFWHIVRLDLTYFLPWPIIIPCLIILDRKPLECWPLYEKLCCESLCLRLLHKWTFKRRLFVCTTHIYVCVYVYKYVYVCVCAHKHKYTQAQAHALVQGWKMYNLLSSECQEMRNLQQVESNLVDLIFPDQSDSVLIIFRSWLQHFSLAS